MSEKSVSVFLTPQDIAAEAKPRRRRTRKVGGAEETVLPPTPSTSITTVANTTANTTATIHTTAKTTVSEIPTPAPPTPATTPPAPAHPTTTPPTQGGVHIKTRKRIHGSLLPPTPVPSTSTARILPIKRHAPPSKEKPKLRIPVASVGGVPQVQQVPQVLPTQPMQPAQPAQPIQTVQTIQAAQTVQPTNVPKTPEPQKAGKKRRFTERRIGISVKSLKTTRKARKSIRKQVASMSVDEIHKVLTEKGLLKGKTNPPEAMLRSLMKDYLSLKH